MIQTRHHTERADQTRARILEAAIHQFGVNGLAGARTEQIAKEAGVNKALIYYYFSSKKALYSACIEAVTSDMQTSVLAMLEAETSAGERFLRIVLKHFDRMYSDIGFAHLMQQEMIRLHRGEDNTLVHLAERLFGPMWLKVRDVVEGGIQTGELVSVDWMQMFFAGLGANVFYFLSAPLIGRAMSFEPLASSALECRRKAAIEYIGQTIFVDREYGARVATRVLADTPMPPCIVNEHGMIRRIRSSIPKKARARTSKT
jgi:TetR/AcrR family transcriptional regulator